MDEYRVPLIASAADMHVVPEHYAPYLYGTVFIAMFAGCLVYYRALTRLGTGGGRVRIDLFGIADMPVVATILIVLGLSAVSAWMVEGPKAAAEAAKFKSEHILPGALQYTIFPLGIVFFFYARNVSAIEVFGLRKVPVLRALGYALGFLIALLPLFFLTTDLTARCLGGDTELQPLVELYREGVRKQDHRVIWHTFLAAAVIAPISEEVLFRGYLYPALKRLIGALPSAVISAVLFAAIHNNAVSLPGLTLLALALTIAFEWSGSLMVPVFIHSLFNSLSLVIAALTAHQPV